MFYFVFFKNNVIIKRMDKSDNLHSGHRNRMIEKLYKNPDSLTEHELLEILLYDCIPRVNTNGISHSLIHTFGSLENIFAASPEDLTVVEGIGKKTAAKIVLLGKIYSAIYKKRKSDEPLRFTSFGLYKNKLIEYYSERKDEVLLMILLDGRFRKIAILEFEDKERSEVTADIPEISRALAINRPVYAILCHNHPSGVLIPSEADDRTTANVYFLCYVHGVKLLDHVIVVKNDALSYNSSHRMDYIKEKFKITELAKNLSDGF